MREFLQRRCTYSMDLKTTMAMVGGLFISLEEPKEKKPRRIWAKKWLQERTKFSHMALLKELTINEPQDFRNYIRMDETSFKELLQLVSGGISKQNTVMRESVSAEERLVATLQFLATGRSYENLKFSCAISPQLLGQIIPETCEAIYSVLHEEYLKFPSMPSDWMNIATDFQKFWQFENCLGAMDGKHIAINKPTASGSYYYNYKGFYSVVLFAIVNANYEFIYVHCGSNGRVSDGGVLQDTDFGDLLDERKLNIPSPSSFPNNRNICLPFVFIGDEAFPLKENLMKPYPGKGISHDEKIFNYRLCRARRIVENAFGILACRFQALQSNLRMNLEAVDKILLACCTLHNFLRKKSYSYLTPTSVDWEDPSTGQTSEGEWRQQVSELVGLNPRRNNSERNNALAENIRGFYRDYYNNEGSVHFQENMINHR